MPRSRAIASAWAQVVAPEPDVMGDAFGMQ